MPQKVLTRARINMLYLFPGVILLYFLWGALTGKIYLPGGETGLVFTESSTWLACLGPLLWLVGDVIHCESQIPLSNIGRRVLSIIMYMGAMAAFFGAVLV